MFLHLIWGGVTVQCVALNAPVFMVTLHLPLVCSIEPDKLQPDGKATISESMASERHQQTEAEKRKKKKLGNYARKWLAGTF